MEGETIFQTLHSTACSFTCKVPIVFWFLYHWSLHFRIVNKHPIIHGAFLNLGVVLIGKKQELSSLLCTMSCSFVHFTR